MPTQDFYDLISIGEAGFDTFLKLHDASLMCSVHKETCLLCLSYADKIPVSGLHESLGHNACNVAVGSSRLGLKTALYTIIGNDSAGQRVLEKLGDEGVSTEYVKIQKGGRTTSSVVLNYKTERTILIYHAPRTFVLPKLAPATWVYLTSLGKGFEQVHQQLIKQLSRNGWKLAFNPGDQQLKAGRKKLDSILQQCSLLIINKEEAGTLLGEQVTDVLQALKKLHLLGPELVVLTDGPKGLYGFDGRKASFARPLKSKVLERTGAGDSCSTGIMAALSRKKSLADALLWGAANAASVIEHIGPQDGLLTRPKLLARLKKSKAKTETL